MEAGVRDVLAQADTVCVPMTDGGEGSLDAVLAATSGQRRGVQALNANGDPCDASWGWLGDGKAFIEMAAAAGLEQIPPQERKPLQASSYRSEEHTSELQSLMRISYAVFCLQKKNN